MTKKERKMYEALAVEITKLEDVPVGLIEAIKAQNLKYGIEDEESEYTNFTTLCDYHIHEIADDAEESIDSDYIFKDFIGRLDNYIVLTHGSQYRKDGGLCELEMEEGFWLHVE